MSKGDEWLDEELDKIFSKMGRKQEGKISPVIEEEELIRLLLDEEDPETFKRDAIKALNRARYAVYLCMFVLHAVFEFLDVSDETVKKIKLACLKDAGKAMENSYRIRMLRI